MWEMSPNNKIKSKMIITNWLKLIVVILILKIIVYFQFMQVRRLIVQW